MAAPGLWAHHFLILVLLISLQRDTMFPFHVIPPRIREVKGFLRTQLKPEPRAIACRSVFTPLYHVASPFSSARVRWKEQMGSSFKQWEKLRNLCPEARMPALIKTGCLHLLSFPSCSASWQFFSPPRFLLALVWNLFPGEVIRPKLLFYFGPSFRPNHMCWCDYGNLWTAVESWRGWVYVFEIKRPGVGEEI